MIPPSSHPNDHMVHTVDHGLVTAAHSKRKRHHRSIAAAPGQQLDSGAYYTTTPRVARAVPAGVRFAPPLLHIFYRRQP